MKSKLIGLFIMIFTFASLLFTHGIVLGNVDNNGPMKNNLDLNNSVQYPLRSLHSLNAISTFDPSKIIWGNAQKITVNTELDISNSTRYPVDNQNNYPIFDFTLTKGYYLNLTVFQANWASLNNDPQGTGNLTSYYLDIDFTIFFSNHTSWLNGTSNNLNEIVTSQIPISDTYYVILYAFQNNILTYGSQISSVVYNSGRNQFNTTFYGGNAAYVPHANSIRVQMVDQGYSLYGNNLDLHKALTYDVLPHLPELRTGLTTWLWEYDKFGLPVNDLYKIFVPKNTSISVFISYNDTNYATSISANTEVLSLINYNHYIGYLNGTFFGTYKTLGTNDIGGFSYSYLASSNITNLKSDSDTYFVLSVNNTLLSDAGTFTYNISIDFSDYIDNTLPNNDRGSASDISNILPGYSLWTSKTDNDFFSLIPLTQPQRLTLNLYFDRSYGQINLYLFNKTIETSSNESKSLVGKSDFKNQNQQVIVYDIFDLNKLYIKVNTSVQYSNKYQLNVTLGPIDDQYEPNDNVFQSADLGKPGTYDLFLAKGNFDYFKIFLFNQDTMNATITFDGSIGDLNLRVYSTDLFTILGISASTSGNSESVAITANKNGYYYILVYGNPASFLKPGLDYKLILNIVAMDDYLEPNNNKNQAVPIQDGFFQLISRAGNEDWFNFYMRQSDYMTISVIFDTSKGDIDIFLYDKAVSKLYNSSQSFSSNESFSFTAPYEGEFLIRVALFDGLSVNYNMNITLTDWKYDKYEPNDNFVEAYSLNPGYYNGIIAQGGDHDYFKVNVPTGYAIIVELLNVTSNEANLFRLSLYNSYFALINSSERNLNTQYISPVAVKSATELYIEAYFKGFDKVTYSLNITIGLSSAIFPPPKFTLATNIPSFGINTNQTTTALPPLYNLGTILAIGLVGLGGGTAAGVGGTIIAQKTNLGSKIKLKLKPKK